MIEPHPLDPNFLDFTPPERRVYLDDGGDLFAIVDEEDYAWATRWRWKYKRSKRSTLIYATRCPRGAGEGNPSTTYYLHIEICRRAHGEPPTRARRLVDHADRDTLNCRRGNLNWRTFRQNMANRVLHGRQN